MADPFTTAATVVQIAGGLKGLFGKKAKTVTPRDNIMSQVAGVREAAEKHGFNPLTLLQYANGAGGHQQLADDGPPLASFDMISGGLDRLGDEYSGDADRRRAIEQHNLDLAKVKLEQLRTAPVMADSVGAGASPLGRRTTTVGSVSAPNNMLGGWLGKNANADREIDRKPNVDVSGFSTIENGFTGGPVHIFSTDGEPWGIDELILAGAQVIPQAINNHYHKWIGNPFGHWVNRAIEKPQEAFGPVGANTSLSGAFGWTRENVQKFHNNRFGAR